MASYNITEVVTGGVVLAGAAAFALYATQTTGLGSSNAGYDLTASFRSLEGVSVGTDVRLAGVKIGAVSGVELDTQTYRAVTTISVREGIEIPDDSAAIVASEGLLGGNFVEINPGGSFDYFAPGDEIEDTQGAVSLISLLVQFVAGSGGDSEE
ncbi:outer membrane lipid asymmetry maintenance protein MlaD [Phaeobacter sp. 22II1-1F12B]|uniref:outer membrane lipid asymmetry maintenance protein MlaD n=1 Tax=Phaeobacter sp. 22II1-1F12B TaxID=1317111 RepID=UPI000B527912|nr:outer membrane lipid asymmetry maintenance protein MlaD [Phaeobacter sp. 22II1-1F12B]OWU80608.1 ABC transporter substrate-binding protein [Phaeobacter sp. 22II1-1F12B]